MIRQQLLLIGITAVLVILFMVRCGASASTAVPEAPEATSAPEQVAVTPTPEPPTSAPTLTSEPTPAIEEESAIDPQETGDPERGRQIFENGGEKYADKPQYRCMRCHSLDGSEGNGPSFQGISERAGGRVPELSAAEYLRQSILEPDAYVIEGFSHQMGRIHSVLLSEKEIDHLIAFMLTQ